MKKINVNIEDETEDILNTNIVSDNNISLNLNENFSLSNNNNSSIKLLSKAEREEMLYNKYKKELENKELNLNKIQEKKNNYINKANLILNNKNDKKITEDKNKKTDIEEEQELIKKQYLNIREFKEPKIYDKNKVVFNLYLRYL